MRLSDPSRVTTRRHRSRRCTWLPIQLVTPFAAPSGHSGFNLTTGVGHRRRPRAVVGRCRRSASEVPKGRFALVVDWRGAVVVPVGAPEAGPGVQRLRRTVARLDLEVEVAGAAL